MAARSATTVFEPDQRTPKRQIDLLTVKLAETLAERDKARRERDEARAQLEAQPQHRGLEGVNPYRRALLWAVAGFTLIAVEWAIGRALPGWHGLVRGVHWIAWCQSFYWLGRHRERSVLAAADGDGGGQ